MVSAMCHRIRLFVSVHRGFSYMAQWVLTGAILAGLSMPARLDAREAAEGAGAGQARSAGGRAMPGAREAESRTGQQSRGTRREARTKSRTRKALNWHLLAEAQTIVPLTVGAKLTLEMPWRIRASVGAGWLPGGYVDLINAVVVAAGGYDENTARVIRSSLESSLILRFHLGWRPFRAYGFVLEAGYGLVVLGGAVATEDLLSVATGITPPREPVSHRDYDVSSTLHMVDLELSYRWVLGPGIVLRVGVGFSGTVGAQSHVSPRYLPMRMGPVNTFTKAAENYLDDTYESYVFTPTITAAVGWRPF